MWEFQLRTIEDLRRLSQWLNCPVDAMQDVSILAEPVQAGGLVMPNSLATHPMEGADTDLQGRPGNLTFRRYERFGAGLAGLIWAEATAVAPEGRSNPRQLWLRENSRQSFAALVKKTKEAARASDPEHEPIIVAQLTHSGRYSRPEGIAHPLMAQHDPYRDAMCPQQKPDPGVASKLPNGWSILTDEYLEKLVDAYVTAARIAFEVGFDAVDIKSCHGYLINELFASRQRSGKYGGSFENRTRLLLEIIDKIRAELGPDKPIVTRLGIYDAIPYPYGWGVDSGDYNRSDLTEPKKLIALLQARGVKIINVTIANPYYNPHYGRPFNEPIASGYESPEHPLAGVSRLIRLAGEIQRDFPDIAIVGTGYSWLRTLMPNVAAASKANGLATIIGLGRMAFAYPDFARDIISKGRLDPDKVCVCCSGCTQIMRDGGMVGCVVRDNEVYGPIYEHGRLSDRDNLVRLASACRQCQEPTCQAACPAGMNISRFIRLFLDGDDRAAFEAMRESNIFPEVCAWLCPVEQQCQGSCLQRFIGDGPLPIAAIQSYLARKANSQGWSKLHIPQEPTGRTVAIIGAGPAGLACAAKLLESANAVTIFDKGKEPGGMIKSVIPIDRQGHSLENEITAVFKDVPADRMVLELGRELNAQFNLDTIIQQGFDAVFISIGLPGSVTTGENPDGLWDAMDFLTAAKEPGRLDLAGKSVAVIGGGNTAIDVAITAESLGAEDVYVIYRRSFKEMPAWAGQRDRALNQGVHFLILTQLVAFSCEGGKLKGIRVCPTKLGRLDTSGRRSPEPIQEMAYELDMDIVVEAIGQKSVENLDEFLPGVELENGLIQVRQDSCRTSRRAVFAGGDLVRGPSTVVQAVADGMKAAEEIQLFLQPLEEASE